MPLFRFLGLALAKTFSKLFNLATITFFGRLPSRDDDKVGLIGLLSVTWLVVLAAIPLPVIGKVVFPFLDDEAVIRGVAIALAIAGGPAVGFTVSRLHNRRGERDRRSVARELLFGYGYAAIVGGLVTALLVVVPLVKASHIVKRYELAHLAIMIGRGSYDDVLDELQAALDRHGIATRVERPHWAIYRIFRGLAWIEGHIFRREVATDMKVVLGEVPDGDAFEVTLHSTDISVLGSKKATSMVMAILSEELDEDHLYFAWDDAAQELEDRIGEAVRRLDRDGEPTSDRDIDELCARLRTLSLEPSEWNAIRRQLYKLETASLRARLREPAER
jgi:hypothetical protein